MAVQCHERNVVLNGRPPPISNSEKELTKKERSTLAQLRSGYCRLLGSYKSRIKMDASLGVCADCGTTAPDDTAYKRWSCHSGLKLLCKLCRTSPPQQWGPDLPFFGHAGHADPLDGWRCCSPKRVMSIPIQVRQH